MGPAAGPAPAQAIAVPPETEATPAPAATADDPPKTREAGDGRAARREALRALAAMIGREVFY